MNQPLLSPADRLVPLGAVFNARDVGGYATPHGPIAWRRVLRSAGLDGLDDDARSFLASIGLRTVIDLRRDQERTERPNSLGRLDVRTVPVSISPGALPTEVAAIPSLADLYDDMVESSGTAIATAISALSEPGALPAIVHCTAGKDRTGLVVAFVLALAGVDDDIIVTDYAASADLLGSAFIARLTTMDDDAAVGLTALMASPPELIAAALTRVRDRHGSVEGYLVHHGMDPAVPDRLRAALIEVPG